MAAAENSSVAQQEKVERFDFRKRQDEPLYSITFSAERPPGDTGHAFITFNHEDEQKRMTTFESVGFYPPGEKTDGVVKFYTSVFSEGPLKDDFLHDADTKMVVTVNKEQYEAAREVYAGWKARQEKNGNHYVLVVNDCTTFVGEVARAIGLETSLRVTALFPKDYDLALIENQKERQEAKLKEQKLLEEQKEEQRRKDEAARKLREQQAAAAALMQMEMARRAAAAQQAAAAEAAAQAAQEAAAAQQAAAQRAAAEQAAAQMRAQQEAWAAQQRAQAEAAQRASQEAAARAAQQARGSMGFGPSSGGGGSYSGPTISPLR
ncbi:chemotaxis protein histidine kinase CheA [Bradyrhizobium japonicum]